MEFVHNNNVSLTKEKFDFIKEQSTLYEDNESYICTKERQYDDIDDNVTTIKQSCKIVTEDLNMNIVTQSKKEKLKADKIAEKEKIKAAKNEEKEKLKADKIAEKEKIKAAKNEEKEKIKAVKNEEKKKLKADKIEEKKKLKADKIEEKGKIKANKNVGIKQNNNIINTDKKYKQNENDAKVKGRPRIEYNVKVVTEINDDEQQDYNFLEVEEYCTEVTIDGVIYFRDRNMVLYDYETHEEI